jgi:hypothetical protein
MNMLIINFLLFVFIAFAEHKLAASVECLASVPDNERKELSRFFEEIIFKDSFGYTIFGDKPISFATYNVGKYIRHSDNYSSLIIERGEELWRKYAAILQSKNFVFKFQSFANIGRHEIYLINKKAVQEIAMKHLESFKKILGNDFTPEKLIQELECPATKIQDILHEHEGLFGILLGYGYKNAFAFQRKYELIASIQNILLHPLHLSTDQENILNENFIFFVTEKHSIVRKDNIINSPSIYNNLFSEYLLLKEESRNFGDEQNNPLNLFPLQQFPPAIFSL